MFFTFPENARWDAELQAVEFGVEIGEYQGVVECRAVHFNTYCPTGPHRNAVSRLTTCSGRALRASPSGSLDDAS